MFEYLKENPEYAIATLFTALGYFAKTIIDFVLDKRRRKAQLRELFWKEKIQASKKASEFYYEHLAFLNLLTQKIETEINEKEFSEILAKSFQKQILNLSNKITNPSHYEHHHIHIFYDFDETELNELNKNSFEILQDMESIVFEPDEKLDSIAKKLDEVKSLSKKLKINYEKSIKIYRKYLKSIRGDIKEYIE